MSLCLPLRSEQRSWTGKGTLVHLVSCDLVLWLQVAAAHVSERAVCNVHVNIGPGLHCHCCSMRQCVVEEEEEEGCFKMLPANTADHLCQPCYCHEIHIIIPLLRCPWGLWIVSHVLSMMQGKSRKGSCCRSCSHWYRHGDQHGRSRTVCAAQRHRGGGCWARPS